MQKMAKRWSRTLLEGDGKVDVCFALPESRVLGAAKSLNSGKAHIPRWEGTMTRVKESEGKGSTKRAFETFDPISSRHTAVRITRGDVRALATSPKQQGRNRPRWGGGQSSVRRRSPHIVPYAASYQDIFIMHTSSNQPVSNERASDMLHFRSFSQAKAVPVPMGLDFIFFSPKPSPSFFRPELSPTMPTDLDSISLLRLPSSK